MALVADPFTYLMIMHACWKLNDHNDLVSRIRKTCEKHNVSFFKYVLTKMTPGLYDETYCACLTMALTTALGN